MDSVERMQRVIALNHVGATGDASTQKFVDMLLKEHEAAQKQAPSPSTEPGQLHGNVHRSGLSPAARHLAGVCFAVLAVVCGIAALTMWFGGLVPTTRGMRLSHGAESAPAHRFFRGCGDHVSLTATPPCVAVS